MSLTVVGCVTSSAVTVEVSSGDVVLGVVVCIGGVVVVLDSSRVHLAYKYTLLYPSIQLFAPFLGSLSTLLDWLPVSFLLNALS